MSTALLDSWPEDADADGDVFRRLASSGFDFGARQTVDYNVDFVPWPPPEAAFQALAGLFGALSVYEPSGSSAGYVQFQEQGLLSYLRVLEVQRCATEAVAAFGGVCESWGVMQPANN